MMTAARKFHHAWRVSERAVPSAYKPSSSPSLRTEFALTAIITCPLKTNYSTSFLVVLRLSPLAPPPSFSRSPIIISTRMTRPPLLVHLSSNRLARLLPSLMHPTGRYTASPIFIIQRSIFSSKGLPTESCILTCYSNSSFTVSSGGILLKIDIYPPSELFSFIFISIM